MTVLGKVLKSNNELRTVFYETNQRVFRNIQRGVLVSPFREGIESIMSRLHKKGN